MVETQVEYSVVTDVRRLSRGLQLRDELGAFITIDLDRNSNANHDAAWDMYTSSATWLVVVEDDVELVDNFKQHVEDAINHIPDDGSILSFYAGYPRPEPFRARKAVMKARETQASYLRNKDLLWGPAVGMRTDLIQDMLRSVQGSDEPYDQRFSQWMRFRNLQAYYTMPSLVDHSDIPSLLGRDGVPRKAYWFDQPEQWNSRVIDF